MMGQGGVGGEGGRGVCPSVFSVLSQAQNKEESLFPIPLPLLNFRTCSWSCSCLNQGTLTDPELRWDEGILLLLAVFLVP